MFVEHPQTTSCCCLQDTYIHWFAGDGTRPHNYDRVGQAVNWRLRSPASPRGILSKHAVDWQEDPGCEVLYGSPRNYNLSAGGPTGIRQGFADSPWIADIFIGS